MRTLPYFVFLLSLGAIFYISGNKVNQYGASDPLLTLPTSQALIETGHTYLTHLENQVITPEGRELNNVIGNYQAATINGEIVDVYSPGPAILALPLAAVLGRAGYDLNDPDTNMAVQNRLAFLTSSIVLISLYGLCRVWLNSIPSLVISHITFLGSSMFANMGLAYFNLNIALIFTCWTLILLAVLERKGSLERVPPIFQRLSAASPALIGTSIGLCLFLAFTGRPSAAILIVITFGYLLLNHRTVAYFAMGSALLCLVAFSFWSQAEYGLLIPNYFNPAKTDDAPLPIWVGILGNLFSPSRGMFIVMPWLLLIPALMAVQKQAITSRLSIWIALWFGLLLITVSRSVIWWGGASFGPRLMAEILPGLILLGVSSWARPWKLANYQRPLLIGLFLLSGTFSVWVNSYQPFFNIFTGGAWQDNITGFPLQSGDSLGPFFRWEYSQWMADADQICKQNEEMVQALFLTDQRLFLDLASGDVITHLTDNQLNVETIAQARSSRSFAQLPKASAILQGFLLPQGGSSWSMCDRAAVYFVPDGSLTNTQTIALSITGRASNNQPIDLFINDNFVNQFSTSARPDTPTKTETFELETTLLIPETINSITLHFPESQTIPLPNSDIRAQGKFGYQLTALSLTVAD